VALTEKSWGTHIALRLAGVPGPEKCALIAIGADGTEETVTTWSVPAAGYGVDGGAAGSKALFTDGGAAMSRDEIDRFEVRTDDGQRLVTIKV
jgi:hypothetical protein